MPVQGNQQPTNPYAPTGKNVGARSAQEIQWDIDNTPANSWGNPRILQDELNAAQYVEGRRNAFEQLRKDGYTGTASGSGYQQTSLLGTGGKWGDISYGDAYANAKATGNWSQIDAMLNFADNNPRERSGFMGTGISISPMAMMGMALGGFGALGGFTGAAAGAGAGAGSAASGGLSSIAGFTPGASLTGSLGVAPSFASGLGGFTAGTAGGLGGLATGGLTSAGSLLGGTVNGASILNNATSGAQQGVTNTSSISDGLGGFTGNGGLGGQATGGLTSGAGNSLLNFKNAQKVAKLANAFGGGGSDQITPQQAGAQQQPIPNISQASPDFRNSIQDRLNLNTQLPQQQHRPFMTVQEMFDQRYN